MRQQLFLPHAALCATAGAGGSRCDRRCGGGFIVLYPFGFSGDCPILLGCNASASTPLLPRSTAVAPYPVLSFNSASSTFVVSLALSCNRTVGDAAASLSGASYGVSSRTTVFLRGGCRDPPPSNCTAALPASFIAQAAQCGSGAASDTVWTCVSSERPPAGSTEEARGQGQFLNWTSVQDAGCEDAVTASGFEAAVPGLVPGLELGVAELGWWLDGACTHATGGGKCAQNATCHDVQTPSGAWGHRCACLVDGMSGDGFTAGEGCHDHDSAGEFLLPWPLLV